MTYNEANIADRIGHLLEENPTLDSTEPGSLDSLDQFHAGGADAVSRLIPSLQLRGSDRVLDVGSGLGGPARQIARTTGNAVVGVDITDSYVNAAAQLTARSGLTNLVSFHCSDIATFQPDQPFDAAITMHVQMNVADKLAWWRQINARLAAGARLAVWEVCQPAETQLAWPMPWSLDGTDSHLADAPSLLSSIVSAGFEVDTWTCESPWVQQWFASTVANGPATGPALPMVLDDGYKRVQNLAAAISQGILEVWRGAFIKIGERGFIVSTG
jgi:SAM-dependent methyltransferase